mgnify:CR=1 FL=1
MNRQTLTHLSLGIPLTISGAATIATIFANKRLHIAFGAAWGVLSILHAFQHREKNAHRCLTALPHG